jgi:hypothetical protein
MTLEQWAFFLGAFGLSLVSATLARWIAATLGADVETRYGVAAAAGFMPAAIPLLAYGAFGFLDALAMLAAMLAACVMFWWFARDHKAAVDPKRRHAG